MHTMPWIGRRVVLRLPVTVLPLDCSLSRDLIACLVQESELGYEHDLEPLTPGSRYQLNLGPQSFHEINWRSSGEAPDFGDLWEVG